MRKLMWFAVGFATACAAGAYLVPGNWLLLLALFCLCAGIGILLLKTKFGKITTVLLLGCVVGLCWFWCYDSFYLSAARQYDGDTVSASIDISDYSYTTDYGVAGDGIIILEDKRFQVRVYLIGGEAVSPGDRIVGEFRLRLTTEGGKQESTHHQGSGIFLLAYAKEEAKIKKAADVTVEYFSAVLREGVLDALDAVFPADTLAFARALLLGDTSRLTYEEDTAFKISGIRYVIAVSGLHVSILFSMVYMASGRRRVMTSLLGIPTLMVFAAAAGFTPSIVRACIMQGLMILALLCNKEYDPPTALAAAVLIMLAVNPMTITSVSFQLSVGCMAGIFLFSKRIHDYILRGDRAQKAKGKNIRARLIRWIVSSISITLSAMAVTTPLSAFYFGAVSIVGILTNLLTLWVVSFVFYGIMLACIAGAVWIPAGKLVAGITSWPIRYVLFMAKTLSSFPVAAVYTCSVYIVIWLVLSYSLLVVFLFSAKKRPVILTGCICVGLVVALAASYIEPRLDDYRVTVLNVGQGQCILFQCDGENYLVDCGGDVADNAADAAAQQLLSQGITKLDGVFLTHYDADHAGGVESLMTRIPVDTLYMPAITDDGTIRESLEKAYSDTICWISEDTVLQEKGFHISLFTAEETDQGNESCLCILFQTEKCDILITGDRGAAGERALLAQTELPQLELLVVGHHGSASSASLELLEATRPKTAVISVSKDNSYGHPSQEVLMRLKLFGTEVWRTDLHGTIIFRG